MIYYKFTLSFFLILVCHFCFSQKVMSFEEKIIPEPNLKDSLVLIFNAQQAGFQNLTSQEKNFYYWVNYSRANPKKFLDSVILPFSKIYTQLQGDYLFSLKKDLEMNLRLPLLSINANLTNMAKNHALDITSKNTTPSHNSTNGESFADRFKKNIFSKCGGENIGFGSDKPVFILSLLYLDIGLPELGHRKALLNPKFTQTGIGYAFYKNKNVFVVEDFACTQN